MTDLSDFEWRRWPLPGAGAACALDPGPQKLASAPPSNSVEDLASRAVDAMRSWAADIPPGMFKVAAQREGDQGELPAPTETTLWRHPNAHPAILILSVLDKYGDEALEWAPETLLATLDRDGVKLSNANKTKLMAACTALKSPSPWRQWEVFDMVCLGLAGQQPNVVYAEEPELGHLVAGFDFMKMVDPERDTSDEIDKFVAAAFKHEGLPYVPPPLDFAQRELEDPRIRCRSCGAEHRDDNDQRCVTCGSPQLEKIPYEYADLRDQVRGLWNDLKGLPLEAAVDKAPDTAAGNAVYRLLVHWDYAHQVRAHLVQQLRMLGD